MFAAMVLALHGHNVDRAFWSTGPGAVGQSLASHLIATAFGKNHAWVDMNVYYDQHEMRKQADLLYQAIITTGQEAPNTDQTMREDIPCAQQSAYPRVLAVSREV